MNDLSNIQQIIKNIAGCQSIFYDAEVVSVSNDTCCVKIGDNLQLSDVALTPLSGDESQTKITILPAAGSKVTVADLSDGKFRRLQILKFSQVDSISAGIGENITIKISDDTLKISSPNMEINSGENGGLINIESMVDKINAIEDDLNNIKSIFKSWLPVSQDGGAALKTATASWFGATLLKTVVDDIEDKTVTH